eukprot:9260469-Karenia_brevis.AAC.1
MVHKHSSAKLAARRERALAKGFISPSTGKSWVEVGSSVAPRVRSIAKSVEFHDRHNRVANASYPHATQATRAVRRQVSKEEYAKAMQSHEAANVSKHNWSSAPLPSS